MVQFYKATEILAMWHFNGYTLGMEKGVAVLCESKQKVIFGK